MFMTLSFRFGHFCRSCSHFEPILESGMGAAVAVLQLEHRVLALVYALKPGAPLFAIRVCFAAGCACSVTVWVILEVFQAYWCRQRALFHHTCGCN